MNRTLKIVGIRRTPRWKLWKVDQWEVTVEIDRKRKKLCIYDKSPTKDSINEKLFLEYIWNKTLYGDQWSSGLDKIEDELQKFVGQKIAEGNVVGKT